MNRMWFDGKLIVDDLEEHYPGANDDHDDRSLRRVIVIR